MLTIFGVGFVSLGPEIIVAVRGIENIVGGFGTAGFGGITAGEGFGVGIDELTGEDAGLIGVVDGLSADANADLGALTDCGAGVCINDGALCGPSISRSISARSLSYHSGPMS